MVRAVAMVASAVLLAAIAWALLRGILELGVGLVAVALVGGWGIGVATRRANGSPLIAISLAAGAWLLGLVFSWLLAMAILQGSSRTLLERLEAVPFTDWMSPQFGVLEIIGLVIYVVVAGYVSRAALRR